MKKRLKAVIAILTIGCCALFIFVSQIDTNQHVEREPITVLTEPTSQVTYDKDVFYQKTKQNRGYFDIAYQKNGQQKPLLVCVHGGSWTGGDKEEMDRFVFTFSNMGYAVATVEYEVLPYASIVEEMECVENAVSYIIDHAEEYEIDPQRVSLIGHSAGAHLALRLGEKISADPENYNYKLVSMISIAAPSDLFSFLYYYEDSKEIELLIQHPEIIDRVEDSNLETELVKVDVVTNIHSDMPPVLLLHGLKDKRVDPSISSNLAKALEEAGVECELELLADMEHPMSPSKLFPYVRDFLSEH